jgi:hypothetical protein
VPGTKTTSKVVLDFIINVVGVKLQDDMWIPMVSFWTTRI